MVTGCIVLYQNKIEVVKKAIDSFLACEEVSILYLVDNSPTQDLKMLNNDPRIVYIFNDKNLGFGKAHNIAIKLSVEQKSDYHFVLNPDIYFDKLELTKMISFLDDNKEFGQLMPQIRFPNEEIQYLCKRNPKPFDLFLRRFAPKFVQEKYKKRMDDFEYRNRDYNDIILDVPYFSGCFMVFRTNILEKIGGFDERIFMYIEDADITRRVLEISRTIYFPQARIYHHYEKGSYKKLKLMFYNLHGAYIYFRKW
jgi:hypothetical protein